MLNDPVQATCQMLALYGHTTIYIKYSIYHDAQIL